MKIKNDFSWRVWLAVLALHVLAFLGLDAALTLNRLEAAPSSSVQAFIVQPDVSAPAPTTKAVHAIGTVSAAEPPSVRLEPTTRQAQGERGYVTLPAHYAVPDSIQLRYTVTKGDDSAKASLTWRMQNNAAQQASYELTYEATYFGVSMLKQTSVGLIGESGLVPVRFGDKRRGKSEQATHFDLDKQRITFSNNRPEAALAMGSQDRSSVLIQLASLFAAEPSKWSVGHLIDIPVASASELEVWRFEVQGVGADTHLIRRAARDFDQTLELWLSPSLGFLPTRIRQTDSSGVTDMQLVGQEKL